MPTVILNKTVFEELVGKELPLDELKDRISMLGTDLEGIQGDEIEVEVFPDRPDMLSEQGFARAFSSFIGEKTGLRKYQVKKSGHTLLVKNTPEYYPYAIAFIAKGIQLDKEKVRELIQLQEKIGMTMLRKRKKGGIGLYPLEKLSFPITFEGKNWKDVKFRPLESPTLMSVEEILEKHKKGKEYKHLMENWDKCTVFTDNNGVIMSMPPIINSHDVGKIEETTQDLFVECTGISLEVITFAINIFAASLADMGAEIYSIEVQHGDKTFDVPNLEPTKMKIDLPYINKLLGLKLTEEDAKRCLEKMGFGYENGEVLVPAYRADILHQVDLMEDIAIAYGYENFEHIIPNVSTIGEEAPLEILSRKIREILIGHGLIEAKNYHLVTKDELNSKMNREEDVVSLLNAVGEQNHLRNEIIPSLMKTLRENQHHEFPQNVFEIGRTFWKEEDTETGIGEAERLAVLLCHEKTDFTQIKQILDALMNSLGIECTIKESEHPSYIEGRVGEMWVGDSKLGIIGELHPQVLTNWELVVPTVAFELDIEKVFELVG
jgi:phenylalanyl-tRNA synthetase beta chain